MKSLHTFSWPKAIGFGLLLWLVMFAVVSALVGFDVSTESVGWSLAVAAISAVAAFILGAYSSIRTFGQALGYGLVWVAIGVGLDLIISRQFSPEIFRSWEYWLGYGLVMVAVLVWPLAKEEQIVELEQKIKSS